MNRQTALTQLSMCFQGQVPPGADWMAMLDLANRSLATAQLCTAVMASSSAGALPDDVRVFLLDVQSRNRERNRRLVQQLKDALRALNAVGIEPVLLKGIALWASRPDEVFDRILADIDLLVRGTEVDRAVGALRDAGFALTARYPGNDVHVVAELGRPDDVGLIDLHQRPPGPPGLAEIDNLTRLLHAGQRRWAARHPPVVRGPDLLPGAARSASRRRLLAWRFRPAPSGGHRVSFESARVRGLGPSRTPMRHGSCPQRAREPIDRGRAHRGRRHSSSPDLAALGTAPALASHHAILLSLGDGSPCRRRRDQRIR